VSLFPSVNYCNCLKRKGEKKNHKTEVLFLKHNKITVLESRGDLILSLVPKGRNNNIYSTFVKDFQK